MLEAQHMLLIAQMLAAEALDHHEGGVDAEHRVRSRKEDLAGGPRTERFEEYVPREVFRKLLGQRRMIARWCRLITCG